MEILIILIFFLLGFFLSTFKSRNKVAGYKNQDLEKYKLLLSILNNSDKDFIIIKNIHRFLIKEKLDQYTILKSYSTQVVAGINHKFVFSNKYNNCITIIYWKKLDGTYEIKKDE
jgi:hypothetical protein